MIEIENEEIVEHVEVLCRTIMGRNLGALELIDLVNHDLSVVFNSLTKF